MRKEGAGNVLGAIALDKNRYADRNVFYRVVVYTDGTIKEPNAPATMPVSSEMAKSLAEKNIPRAFPALKLVYLGSTVVRMDRLPGSKRLRHFS
jgi:hypothetical protein